MNHPILYILPDPLLAGLIQCHLISQDPVVYSAVSYPLNSLYYYSLDLPPP